MPETPPPFYSRKRTRTRPAHRRIEVDPGPDLTRFRRRLSRTSVMLAAFIAIVGIGTASVRQARNAPTSDPLPAGAPADAVSVAVSRIIDGDTLDVRSAETTLRVRLYGVNTPERGQPCAAEATQRLTALAADRVLLVPDARAQDQYGRELRYVFTADGRSIDYALVAEGLAKAWREDGSRKAQLIATEETARAAKTGCLWAKPAK
ncbi:MAG: thermonuclease family protein [Chloroflexota bacterium]